MIESTVLAMGGYHLDTAPDVTPAVAHSAALTVIEYAHDRDDARHLLGVLGLGGEIARVVTVLECGHPSTDGYRRTGQRGVLCRRCIRVRHGGA